MPYPAKNEERSMFVKRAVPQIVGEGKTAKQAVGQAEGMMDTYGKGKETSKETKKESPAEARKESASIFTRMGKGKPKMVG